MITLSDGITTVELPSDLIWIDRTWSPVVQSFTRGLTGKPIIQAATAQHGQPITLEPPATGGWWYNAPAKEDRVLLWHNTAGQVLTLTLRGTAYSVRFRHSEGPAYDSTPLRYQAQPGPDYILLPSFRFITVEP